jgi:V/A-type H+-transporting ATPase subunit I
VRASALEAAAALDEEERHISSLYAEQSKLKTQILSLAPWLELDVPLETASTRDVTVKFGTISAEAPLETVRSELQQATKLAELISAGADRELRYLLFICHKSAEDEATEVLKQYGFSQAALRGWTGTAAENTRRIEAEIISIDKQLEEAKVRSFLLAANGTT